MTMLNLQHLPANPTQKHPKTYGSSPIYIDYLEKGKLVRVIHKFVELSYELLPHTPKFEKVNIQKKILVK